jgi:hypothetical protein
MKSGTALCADCRAGEFRLPGRSGVALFIRSGLLLDDEGEPRLCADVGLLTPTAWVAVLQQPVVPGLGRRLSEFLISAADGAGSLREDALGLHLDAAQADEDIEIRISTFSEPEPRSVSMMTSQAALLRASRDALTLDSTSPEGD